VSNTLAYYTSVKSLRSTSPLKRKYWLCNKKTNFFVKMFVGGSQRERERDGEGVIRKSVNQRHFHERQVKVLSLLQFQN